MSFDYESPDVLLLSNSSRGTYRSCEHRFWLRKVVGARRREDNFAGNAGTAMHNAWYEYIRGQGRDAAVWRLMQDFPIRWQKSPMDDRSLEACYGSLNCLMDSPVLGEYQLAEVGVNGTDEPAIEVPFALHVLNDDGDPFTLPRRDAPPMTVVYIGYIDLILFAVLQNQFLVTDLKTTTKVMPDYNPMFQFDEQCLPYALVLERMLGAPIDELQVKYVVVVIDHLEPRILTLDYHKNQDDVQEWLRSFAMELRDMRTYSETDWWPRRSQACTGFRVCQYANNEMCSSRNPDFIRQNFELEHGAIEAVPSDRPKFEPWFRVDLQIGGLK